MEKTESATEAILTEEAAKEISTAIHRILEPLRLDTFSVTVRALKGDACQEIRIGAASDAFGKRFQ